jgi:hypothetical protein
MGGRSSEDLKILLNEAQNLCGLATRIIKRPFEPSFFTHVLKLPNYRFFILSQQLLITIIIQFVYTLN